MAKKAYIGVDGVARKIKKGYIGVENFVKRTLPSGYTQVAYIESNGTQYINTGFKPNQNTRVVFYGHNLSTASSWIYGTWHANADRQFCANGKNTYSVRYGSGSAQLDTLPVGDFEIDQNKNAYNYNGKTGTIEAQTFTCSYEMYLFAINAAGSVSNGRFTGRLHSCQIYDNDTLVRDFVPCKNSGGTIGLYDLVNGVFYADAAGGTFTAGAVYSSLARKIKKAYIGIGGVARPCWSGGELTYYGTATALSKARRELAATTVGNYALFGGGYSSTSTVNAYNKALTRSTPTSLSLARYYLSAATIGNYGLFAGGHDDDASGYSTTKVDSYNTSLTRGTPTALSFGRREMAATTVGNYALFGGGYNNLTENGLQQTIVDAYNKSLTRSNPTALKVKRYRFVATTVGNYAIFAGGATGEISSPSAAVDAYDASLTRTTPTSLSVARYFLAATPTGGFAIFAGGTGRDSSNKITYCDTVDVYNSALTRSVGTALSYGRYELAATTIEDFAIFAGGYNQKKSPYYRDEVDVYDGSLTKISSTNLTTGRDKLAATTVGNFALFGGGRAKSGQTAEVSAVVEAYTVA